MEQSQIKKYRIIDVRMAIYNPKFREIFPELEQDFIEHDNSSCSSCVNRLVKKIISNFQDRLDEYFKLINNQSP